MKALLQHTTDRSLSLLFSPSGEPWTQVLFLWFFTSSRRVMTTLVSFSQMQLSSFCLFISSLFLPTLAHLLQERFSSFTCSFLTPFLTSWLTSHKPLLRKQTKSSIHSHVECLKGGLELVGPLPAECRYEEKDKHRDKVGEWAQTYCQSSKLGGEKQKLNMGLWGIRKKAKNEVCKWKTV